MKSYLHDFYENVILCKIYKISKILILYINLHDFQENVILCKIIKL